MRSAVPGLAELAARPLFWAELFLINNVAFLAVDIAIAHAVNAFAHPAEWVPIGCSVIAVLLLVVAMAIGGPLPVTAGKEEAGAVGARRRLARRLGFLAGAGCIVVGVAGLLWHLNSAFFARQTLKNLVYTAPFVAPLAYTGVGLLAILNRMVDDFTEEWGRWVILLAGGGFVGNFVLCLADHAQNGFYYRAEWAGVIAAAAAIGILTGVLLVPDNPPLRRLAGLVMFVQIGVGVAGSLLHTRGNLSSAMPTLWERFLYGSPVFAPLLFADLALLALLGLWAPYRGDPTGQIRNAAALAGDVARVDPSPGGP
jgi:hypothetical protein